MSEKMPIFTIPDVVKNKSSVSDTIELRKVVGLIAPDGREIWAPDAPGKKGYRGSYARGYSRADVAESGLELGARFHAKFARFFNEAVAKPESVPRNDVIHTYDCHWLAFWMMNLLDSDHTLDDSLYLAKQRIKASIGPQTGLELGEIGVLGCNTDRKPMAVHSFVGLRNGLGLQAMGICGPIAITTQDLTLQHYDEIAQEHLGYEPSEDHGVHLLRGPGQLECAA